MKPYEQLFDELVPAGFTARQKSDFLYFCKEYCEILNGKNADFIGIIKKNDGGRGAGQREKFYGEGIGRDTASDEQGRVLHLQ